MEWNVLAAKFATMNLPVLGRALATLGASSIPIIGGLLGGVAGDGGEQVGVMAAKMIADALGVTDAEITAEAIDKVIEGQPTSEVMAKLQAVESEASAMWAALPVIAHEDTEAFKAGLADNEDARRQMMALVATDTATAWGPVVVSTMVVVSFTVVLMLWLFFPPSSYPLTLTVLNILVGTLAAGFTQVVSYWLGSSAGSKDKDSALKSALAGAQINTNQAIAAPAKVAAAAKPVSGKK